jgi:hypothetical protein
LNSGILQHSGSGDWSGDQLPEIQVKGPLSDDVLPIIFGYDHTAVYIPDDVAQFIRPHMSPTQRLLPVRCDGDPIPYHLLVEPAPHVWLPENWCYIPCAERSAHEFSDRDTIISPIFPDTFAKEYQVHFVGNYGGFFIDLQLWTQLRKSISNLNDWIGTSASSWTIRCRLNVGWSGNDRTEAEPVETPRSKVPVRAYIVWVVLILLGVCLTPRIFSIEEWYEIHSATLEERWYLLGLQVKAHKRATPLHRFLGEA